MHGNESVWILNENSLLTVKDLGYTLKLKKQNKER